MLIRLDPTGPALDVDDGGHAALLAALTTPAGPAPGTAEALAAGGVVVGGRPHPLAAPLLATLAAPPLGQIRVRVAGPDRVRTHEVLLKDAGAVVDVAAGATRRLYGIPAAAVAAHLARLVGLGPRPRLPEPEAVVVTSALPDLGASAAPVRSEAAARLAAEVGAVWPDVAHAVGEGTWRLWAITWQRRREAALTRLVVLDTPAGLLRVSTGPGPAGLLDPLAARRAWIDLVAPTASPG